MISVFPIVYELFSFIWKVEAFSFQIWVSFAEWQTVQHQVCRVLLYQCIRQKHILYQSVLFLVVNLNFLQRKLKKL